MPPRDPSQGLWSQLLLPREASDDVQRTSRGIGIENVRRGLLNTVHTSGDIILSVTASWTELSADLAGFVYLNGNRPVELGFHMDAVSFGVSPSKFSFTANGTEVTGLVNGVTFALSHVAFLSGSWIVDDLSLLKPGRNRFALVYTSDAANTVYGADPNNHVRMWAKEL